MASAFEIDSVYFGNINNFRLSLTSGLPVTTADVTAATNLYLTPYTGKKIALYDGTNWNVLTSAEVTLAVPATTGTVYDIFAYDNAGVLTLELTAWTNATTRATALVYQDGILCKTGALTRRYLGTFATHTVAGQTEDSFANRLLWNYYNRVRKTLYKAFDAATWNYNAYGAWRSCNNSNANRIYIIQGVSEDSVSLGFSLMSKSNGTATSYSNGIGLSSVTAASAYGFSTNAAATTDYVQNVTTFNSFVAAGYYYLQALETISGATDTVSVYSTLNSSVTKMTGSIMC